MKMKLVCANLVNTSYKADLKLGDKVNIPVMSALTAAAVDVTTTGVITNLNTSIGTTAESITINKWYECPVQIDDSVRLQTMVGDMAEICARNAAYQVAKQVDTEINTLFENLSGDSVYGSDGQTFTDDIMIALMETLDKSDVDRDNRSLIIDPSTIADIYKIDKFVRLDYQKTPVVATGNIGQMYGVPVYVTNNLEDATTGSYGALLHRDAIGLVIQEGPTVRRWREETRHSTIINVDTVWGCAEIRDDHGKAFYTRSKTS